MRGKLAACRTAQASCWGGQGVLRLAGGEFHQTTLDSSDTGTMFLARYAGPVNGVGDWLCYE